MLTVYDELGSGVQKAAKSIREFLFDYISNLSPEDTPTYSNLQDVSVNAQFIELAFA